ncbi:hypothetical protein VPH35_059894 [Triticum aestivum]
MLLFPAEQHRAWGRSAGTSRYSRGSCRLTSSLELDASSEAEIQGAKTYLCMMKCQELLPCSRTQWMHADPQREQFSINPDLFSCDLGGNIDNVVDGQEKGCSREDILAVICCYTGEKKFVLLIIWNKLERYAVFYY